ncbi:MAG: serine/threonine protein kinase [Kofleriaceae bacterium]|nr:serine/threonine protein kinase [Kofleriaceae bacterium]
MTDRVRGHGDEAGPGDADGDATVESQPSAEVAPTRPMRPRGGAAAAAANLATPPTGPRRRDAAALPGGMLHVDVGDRIGRFTIERRLGAGGMGVVYRAHDPRLDRPVAIKVLRSDLWDDDARGRERLIREGQAMARLSHPNVVTVHEVGQLGDHTFLVMELVDGLTLRGWLRAAPRTWREVVERMRQAGRGLAAAHRAGLVHRDFKPDNVLVDADGRARVMDFGLVTARTGAAAGATPTPRADGEPDATADVGHEGDGDGDGDDGDGATPASAELTRPGSVMGTPAYMAPEQHLAGDVGAAADQWAFCATLFEGLWRALPFPGATANEVRDAVLTGTLRVPERPRLPAALRRIVRRGLQRDPAARYLTMDARRRPRRGGCAARRAALALGAG